MPSNDDIKLKKLEERDPVITLPRDLRAINLDGEIVFFRYWLGTWRQLSSEKQAALKREYGV